MDTPDTQQQTPFKILLIGDSCIDRYKIGTIDRLSPEAPVPVIKVVETYDVPGMADNVNKNLVNLGCAVVFVTNDEVITKTRYVDKRSGQHMLRVDDEPEVTPWDGSIGEYTWDLFDAVIISDYNKGYMTYESIQYVVNEFDGPVFIDTKKTDLSRIQGAIIKINQVEYNNLTTLPTNSELIVTQGGDGAVWKETLYPAKKVEVSDVCGAGDTFLAALAVQYLFTKSAEKAIIFANVASSITVQHRGNYAPSYDEIRIAGY
jgi:D-beta-D-heptose 7-phosphate kinase/D-beta-D-heptose 1-phosphate adenosyltransferase